MALSYLLFYFYKLWLPKRLHYSGIEHFSSGILVVTILMPNIAVSSSSPAVCGFSSSGYNGIQ